MRTAKINIANFLDNDNIQSIRETISDSAKVFELFRQLGCEHKSTSYMRMHRYGYERAKELAPHLPTAILQQTAKNALASLKSWNSNIHLINAKRKKFNKKAEKKGWDIKPMAVKWEYGGSRKCISYPINLLSLSRRGELTTFSANGKRIRVLHKIPQWFDLRYGDKKLQAGNVCIKGNGVFLNLVFKTNESSNQRGDEVVGLDRGINNIVATSRGEVASSRDNLLTKARYQYNRKALQQKGTRSAKRHLKKMSGREKRFMLDVNHCLTKQLANDNTVGTYVLEDLTGIRNAFRGKAFNRLLSNWSFVQFEFQLKYKCAFNGIKVEFVDPRFTSQKCSLCKRISKGSRNGNRYTCVFCGHKEHADVNAAKNIRDNYILGRFQPSNRSGVV